MAQRSNFEKNIISTIQRVYETLKREVISLEIIIVNDGSTDKTKDLLVMSELDFLVLEHESNRGYGASLKTGIEKSKFNFNVIIYYFS